MKEITLGRTGITVPQNAFGALPIQRDDLPTAAAIVRRAYEGGMRFFDTARAYTDSEEKLAAGLKGVRDRVYIASKTQAKTPEDFWKDLETTLHNLQTDYLDLYQFHFVKQCWRPGDGTGMYECMLEAKKQGKIRHIGVTTHSLDVGMELIESGLYETLQFPFSYLSSERDLALVKACTDHGMGFIAMKGLAGGLITDSRAAMAFMQQFDGVLPIWGIQRMTELEEWLSYMDNPPAMTEEIEAFLQKERQELSGNFCRGCGYCMPCPQGIQIPTCARMSLFLRRMPTENYLTPEWQAEMAKIDTCIECGHCKSKCPYSLDTPALLKKNYEDYKTFLH
ncbi:MAG: aldo/keto reductase [Lachnospiraceae bacterium]|nr:aldo/keto reductase [Lachnospiraceae bacterium]